MTQREYWECVTRLGRLEPSDTDLAEGVRLAESLDPKRVYAAILASRVYTSAMVHLVAMGTRHTHQIRTMLQELADSERRRREKAAPETRAVLQHAAAGHARVIKGLPLRELYDKPELRHEGDIDLQTPDWPSALAFARWLRGRGWQWDTTEFPWLKWTDGGHLYGQFTLVLPDNEAPFARVDLHIGPYSVGHAGLMPLVGWRPTTVLGLTVDAPDRETTLALIAAHAMNDGVLSMKDINDLWMLLSQPGSIDWASAEELCQQVGAVPALRQLTDVTHSVYDRGPAAGAGTLHYGLTQHARARRVARLTYADECARGNPPWRARRTALTARRYYSADLTPRVTATRTDPAPVGELRRRDVCWRLLPQTTWSRLGEVTSGPSTHTTETLAADLTLLCTAHGSVIRLADEIFVPTVWGRVSPGSVGLARAVTGL